MALVVGSYSFAAAAPAQSGPAGEAPAGLECELDAWLTGAGSSPGGSGTSRTVTSSVLLRTPLAPDGWFFGWGVQAEEYRFSGAPDSLRVLRDVAAQLVVEYYLAGQKVASLSVRPGYYFGRRFSAAAWDVPVDLVAGFPLAGPTSGVAGFSAARYYHRTLPIFGIVRTLGSRTRLELVYPAPALVTTLGRTTSLRIGGELNGAGFRTDRGAIVEYSSYTAGLELAWQRSRQVRFTLGVGSEVRRSFDFFREGNRERGSGGPYLKLGVVLSR